MGRSALLALWGGAGARERVAAVRAVLIRILLTLLVAGTAFIQGLMGGSAHSAPPQAETPSAGVSSFPPLVPEGEVFQDLPQLLRNISWRDPVYSVAIGPTGSVSLRAAMTAR